MCCKVTHPTDLIVHTDYLFLAATPDVIINDDLLLEVKCPKVVENRTIASLARGNEKLKTFCLDENLKLKRTHPYFSQVQCQLACAGARYCDFYVWLPNGEPVRDRIGFDAKFWASKMQKKNKLLFYECLLPEIVDHRKCRNMAIRERASFTPRTAPEASSVKWKLD